MDGLYHRIAEYESLVGVTGTCESVFKSSSGLSLTSGCLRSTVIEQSRAIAGMLSIIVC